MAWHSFPDVLMELFARLLLASALTLGLCLAWQMLRKKAGRGNVMQLRDFNLPRTLLASAVAIATFVEVIAPGKTWPFAFTDTQRMIGLVAIAAGFGVRIWAQKTLGKNWSADVSVRQDHELVCTGPYRFTPHPIYVAYIPITIGALFATGNLLLSALAATYTVASLLRIPAEGRLLRERFPGAYEAHVQDIVTGRCVALFLSAMIPNVIFGLLPIKMFTPNILWPF